MDHRNDSFFPDLFTTLSAIAKIIMWIVWKVNGFFLLGIPWLIAIIILTFFAPMGATIAFIVLKLVGKLTVGWAWIILTLVLDGLMMNVWLNLNKKS